MAKKEKMGYIVLARKWRPQGFEDLVGQEAVVQTFKNALSNKKIVHAYLFSGPRGVGKTSTARILARALNCIHGPSSEPCGKCENCKAITEGSSVDVLEIDGASNTSVDDVRELREAVKYAPSGGRYKIYIIDEVHMLSTPAFNALLKTLEEPPAHTVFIFATTEPKKIPATILSRCQHHAFRRIPKEKIKGQLKRIIDIEGIKINDMALEMLARAADGSMRDALTLLDQACSFSDNITEKELQSLLGLPEADIILNLSEGILKGEASKTISIIKDLTDRGYDLRSLTRELVEHFRNMAIVKITNDAQDILESSPDEIQRLRQQASEVSLEYLTLLLTELLRLEGEVRNAINPRYTLELGLIRTSLMKGMAPVTDILKRLGGPLPGEEVSTGESSSYLATSIQSEMKPEKSNEAVTPAVQAISNREELWRKLLEDLDSKDHLLACKLSEAKVISLTEKELTIGFNGGMSVLADSIKKDSHKIEDILKGLTSSRVRLKIVSLPPKKRESIKSIKEKVISEPIVQNAMKMFNGSILEVRPLDEGGG